MVKCSYYYFASGIRAVKETLNADSRHCLALLFFVLCSTAEGGWVAEWLACWTRAQKGPGSNRSHDAVG